ncbi:MAG TPA: bifunctional serine/threonine-protein kinase/formylglycine-generating enzyme family protein [Steroidobacteraceae bacterium]|nr:bifunctional serine/threonine-protein kinase/formylglycine-generating enzyme family protein [Steroidobacteraceae bacterium]
MTGFVQALEAHRQGALSREDLLVRIERLLRQGGDAGALLSVLNEEHARAPLPGNLYSEAARILLRWRERRGASQTISAATAAPVGHSAPADGSATVIIDEPFADIAVTGGSDTTGSGDTGPKRFVPPSVSVGAVLQGRFKLIGAIGDGGTSTVFKAIDLRRVEARAHDPYVAVKLLTIPLRDFTRSLVVLQREAQRLQSLPHPNIVRVIDCDRDGRTVFMTMEYLAGESLKRKLSAPGFTGYSRDEAVRIVEAIASALTYAHRNGIIHGDLKPGNVIVTDQDEIKVIDFGIARLIGRSAEIAKGKAREEAPPITALTPLYASPEMLEHEPPDPRDDVYALACIAYELLTGRHPFDGKVATAARDAGMRVTRGETMSRRQWRAITRGLAYERDKRTPTPAQFVEEFRNYPSSREGITAFAGIAAVLLLALLYFVDHGRVEHWIAARRITPPAEGEVFRDCPTCPLMKALPSGRFLQGAAATDADATSLNQPQHAVTIRAPFGIGVYEITVGEFREFVDTTQRKMPGCTVYDGTWHRQPALSWSNVGYPQTANHPVACVSWGDAAAYAQWLSGKTGQHYRLASASEWEYAARARAPDDRPWGLDTQSACRHANVADETAVRRYPGWTVHPCSDGYVYSAPVGSFAPNAFGLYDMLGNVFEWVQDCWRPDYQNAPTDGSAVTTGDCTQHDLRGGSWFTAPSAVGAAARNRFEESYRSSSVGFRVVREIRR